MNENSGRGQIRELLQVMKSSSTTHGISSSAASTREFMKHIIDILCTRVPKNCKYTELKLYFTVRVVYVVYLCDSHQYPVFTAIQSFKMFAQDLLSIAVL